MSDYEIGRVELWDRIRALEARVAILEHDKDIVRPYQGMVVVHEMDIQGTMTVDKRRLLVEQLKATFGEDVLVEGQSTRESTKIVVWRKPDGDAGETPGDTEAPSTGGDQQPEQRQDPLRWGGSREVPHSSRVLPYEGGTG